VLLHLSQKHSFRTPLADEESFLPKDTDFLFFDFKSHLMIGADQGNEILRSPWCQSPCWEMLSMTCKGLLPNTEAIVKNLNPHPGSPSMGEGIKDFSFSHYLGDQEF
jgi:hypothetical protein